MALTRFRAHQLGDFDFKESVRVATTVSVTLSGGAPNSVDGVSLAAGNRILVWKQSTSSQNGIYEVQTVGTGSNGTWVRSVDTNSSSKVTAGLTVRTEEGTLYGARGFRLTTPNPITLGTTGLTFELDGGAAVAGGAYTTVQYNDSGAITGDSNLTWSGSTLTVSKTTAATDTTTGAIITTGGVGIGGNAHIGGSTYVTGSITAQTITSNISSGTAPFTVTSTTQVANLNVATAGTVTTAAQPNITSVGTLSSLNVNAQTNATVFSSNIATGTAPLVVASTTRVANLNVASAGTLVNGNSNVNIVGNSNVSVSVAGNTNVIVITGTGANIAGTLHVTGTSNLGAVTNLTLTGGTAGQVVTTDGSGGLSFNDPPSGVTFNASSSAPSLPLAGDQWYDTGTDTLFTRINDGTSAFWLDISSQPNSFDTLYVANNTTTNNINVNANAVVNALTVNVNLTVGNISTSGLVGGTLTVAAQPNITSLGNLTIANIDNIQLDANTISTTNTNGNLTISPNGTGSVVMTKTVLPNANATLNLGSSTLRWATVYGVSSSAQYADLAEFYEADADYDKASVVILAGSKEMTVTAFTHDTRVLGVISTRPAFLMNDCGQAGNWKAVALTGRVPCKVKGPVSKGDVLVTSSVVGAAEKLDKSKYEPGCVLGKSLEDHPGDDVRVIEVVIGRF